jgi:hypothetical protein
VDPIRARLLIQHNLDLYFIRDPRTLFKMQDAAAAADDDDSADYDYDTC